MGCKFAFMFFYNLMIRMRKRKKRIKRIPLGTKCPFCWSQVRQVRNGTHRSGSIKVKCRTCNRGYTLAPRRQGYPFFITYAALSLYGQFRNYRRVAKACNVHHQTVINWVKKYKRGFNLTYSDMRRLREHKLGRTYYFDYSLQGGEGRYYLRSLRNSPR